MSFGSNLWNQCVCVYICASLDVHSIVPTVTAEQPKIFIFSENGMTIMMLIFAIRMSRSYGSLTSQATVIFRRLSKIVVCKSFSIFNLFFFLLEVIRCGKKYVKNILLLKETCDLHNPLGIEVHRKSSNQLPTCTVCHFF